MRHLVWTLVGLLALGAAPQAALAQNRGEVERREERIRELRRQEERARQQRLALERQSAAARRAREQAYDRNQRRDDDRSIADILRERRDRDARNRDIDWRRYDDRRIDARRGNGPPFCRSGEGHPVHGRQWCRDKGWALGNDRLDRRQDVLRRAPDPARERDRRREVIGRARGVVERTR